MLPSGDFPFGDLVLALELHDSSVNVLLELVMSLTLVAEDDEDAEDHEQAGCDEADNEADLVVAAIREVGGLAMVGVTISEGLRVELRAGSALVTLVELAALKGLGGGGKGAEHAAGEHQG